MKSGVLIDRNEQAASDLSLMNDALGRINLMNDALGRTIMIIYGEHV